MVQWGSNEEPYWKFPQRSQSITLIISLFPQSTASISNVTRGFWQSGPLERGTKCLFTIGFLLRTWLSPSMPVEISSCPELTGMSSSAPSHKNVAKIWLKANGKNYIICDENQITWNCMKPHFLEALLRIRFQRSLHQPQILNQTV